MKKSFATLKAYHGTLMSLRGIGNQAMTYCTEKNIYNLEKAMSRREADVRNTPEMKAYVAKAKEIQELIKEEKDPKKRAELFNEKMNGSPEDKAVQEMTVRFDGEEVEFDVYKIKMEKIREFQMEEVPPMRNDKGEELSAVQALATLKSRYMWLHAELDSIIEK